MDSSDPIAWFQQKIGRYDKALWERTIEQKEIKVLEDLNCAPRKSGNLKPELIDIDLIRGSTFSKAKPVHGWFVVLQKGLLRVLFYPFYYKWWRSVVPSSVCLFFLLLYITQVLAVIFYTTYSDKMKLIYPTEAFGPVLIMFVLGVLHTQVVSTTVSNIDGISLRSGRHRKSWRKKSKAQRSRNDLDSSIEDLTHKTHRDGVRKRVRKKESSEKMTPILVTTKRTSSTADPSATDVSDDEGEHDDVYQEKSHSEGTEAERSERTEEEFFENNESSSSGTSYSDNESVTSNFDEEDPFKWDKLKSSESRDTNLKRHSTSTPTAVHRTLPTLTIYIYNHNGILNEVTVGAPTGEMVGASIWEGRQFKRVELTLLDMSSAIINKMNDFKPNSGYLHFAVVVSLCEAFAPSLFRLYDSDVSSEWTSIDGLYNIYFRCFGDNFKSSLVIWISLVQSGASTFCFLFLLCVAERTLRQRLLCAKLFGTITSSRRARRHGLPHFRLHKVKNIKMWLCLRSLLKRRGPQRSVSVIISTTFVLSVCLVVITCLQLLKVTEKERFLSKLFNVEFFMWSLVLCIYQLRFVTLGSKINRKFRNNSVLMTEQLNLYLQMEKNPGKKDELMIANNVLKLASKLLKDLESPYKISGLATNPLLYNITRVVVLSLISGVMSDLLGFRLKVWKIKA